MKFSKAELRVLIAAHIYAETRKMLKKANSVIEMLEIATIADRAQNALVAELRDLKGDTRALELIEVYESLLGNYKETV